MAQSALKVTLKLVMRCLVSITLIGLRTVHLQFQGLSVRISLRLVLRIAQLTLWLQSGHHVNISHPVGVSVFTRQLTGHGSERGLQPLRRKEMSLTLLNDSTLTTLSVFFHFCIFSFL